MEDLSHSPPPHRAPVPQEESPPATAFSNHCSINSLATELILEIAKAGGEECDSLEEKQVFLAQSSLVCRLWAKVALPLLWDSLELRSEVERENILASNGFGKYVTRGLLMIYQNLFAANFAERKGDSAWWILEKVNGVQNLHLMEAPLWYFDDLSDGDFKLSDLSFLSAVCSTVSYGTTFPQNFFTNLPLTLITLHLPGLIPHQNYSRRLSTDSPLIFNPSLYGFPSNNTDANQDRTIPKFSNSPSPLSKI